MGFLFSVAILIDSKLILVLLSMEITRDGFVILIVAKFGKGEKYCKHKLCVILFY